MIFKFLSRSELSKEKGVREFYHGVRKVYHGVNHQLLVSIFKGKSTIRTVLSVARKKERERTTRQL